MESPDEPYTHQNQLDIRPQGGSEEVRLQKEIFHAVNDLVATPLVGTIGHPVWFGGQLLLSRRWPTLT
jgi:hypothetical protein